MLVLRKPFVELWKLKLGIETRSYSSACKLLLAHVARRRRDAVLSIHNGVVQVRGGPLENGGAIGQHVMGLDVDCELHGRAVAIGNPTRCRRGAIALLLGLSRSERGHLPVVIEDLLQVPLVKLFACVLRDLVLGSSRVARTLAAQRRQQSLKVGRGDRKEKEFVRLRQRAPSLRSASR